jgi:hypothetical protein
MRQSDARSAISSASSGFTPIARRLGCDSPLRRGLHRLEDKADREF